MSGLPAPSSRELGSSLPLLHPIGAIRPHSSEEVLRELTCDLAQLPLGAQHLGFATSFRIVAPRAEQIELCLFDSPDDRTPSARVPLQPLDDGTWARVVPRLPVGQRYAFRAEGEFDPARGLFFSPSQLLVDPYARAITPDLHSYDPNQPIRPLGVVTAHVPFDPRGTERPRTAMKDTVIYEAHVRGLTIQHPEIPAALRGTFRGVSHPAMIEHYQALGVTAVELLPIHYGLSERALRMRGLTNYWNYNPLNFFALHPRYCSSTDPLEGIEEFRQMVRELHAHGIEVIIDFVPNHTAEGQPCGKDAGPTLSLRGLDGRYYRQRADGSYINDSGCGNTLNMEYAPARQLVYDAMRYMVEELGVDGIRIDEAPILERRTTEQNGEPCSGWAGFIAQLQASEPFRSAGTKFIVEPFDCAEEGTRFHLGRFECAEWNIDFLETARRFWRSESGMIQRFVTRLAGSSDIFQSSGRGPTASINYVASHDGFSAADTWRYSQKHNEANGEENRDGSDNNCSDNCGVEGSTERLPLAARREITDLRQRLGYNMSLTLFIASGTPMIRAGDELLHTALGNNNAYCQDNELSHLNWRLEREARHKLEFDRRMARVRATYPALRRDSYHSNIKLPADIECFGSHGEVMRLDDWHFDGAKCVGVLFSKLAHLSESDLRPGERNESVFVLFNAHQDHIPFRLPKIPSHPQAEFRLLCDTAAGEDPFAVNVELPHGEIYPLSCRSAALFEVVLPGTR